MVTDKTKEEFNMTTMKRNKNQIRPKTYPNAAEPGYFLNRIIDGMLAAATGMVTVAILFFLVML